MNKEYELLIARRTMRECLVLSRENVLAKLETADAEYIECVNKRQAIEKELALQKEKQVNAAAEKLKADLTEVASLALAAVDINKKSATVEGVKEVVADIIVNEISHGTELIMDEDPFVTNAVAADDSLDDLP